MSNSSSTAASVRLSRRQSAPALADADLVRSRALYWVIMGAILLAAVALRVWDLNNTDLWADELHTLRRVRLPLADSIETMLYAGNQTPLYYLLVRALPGTDLEPLRLVSIALGLVNIVLLSEIVVRLYDNRTLALALGAMLAANPMHVLLSRSARYYTLLLALALVTMWCFVLLLRGRKGRGLWAVFWASSSMLYMLHYSALAVPAVQFGFLLLNWRRYRDMLWTWVPVQITAVLPLLAWYGILVLYWFTPYLNGPASFTYDYLGQQLALHDFGISWLYVLMGFDGRWDWALLPGMVIAVAGLLAGAYDAVLAWRRGEERPRATWALLAVITFVVLFTLSYITGAQYRDRYYTVVLGAVLIMFGLGVRRWSQPVAVAALAVIILTSAYATIKILHAGEHERTDWTGVVAYVSANYQPGDSILSGRDIIYEAFDEYYDRDSARAPDLMDQFVMLQWNVGAEDHDVMMAIEPQGARVWVLFRARHEDFHRQDWEYQDPLTPKLSPESDWLILREDRIISAQEFDGVTVFLLEGVQAAESG